MNKKMILATVAVLPLLAACAGNKDLSASEGQTDPHFGDALKRDMAAQIVHPDAPLTTAPIALEGQRAALAQDNYVKDKVKEPEDISIGTRLGSGSGSSGSSGSSQ
jgi:hypothetical protein